MAKETALNVSRLVDTKLAVASLVGVRIEKLKSAKLLLTRKNQYVTIKTVKRATTCP